MWDLSSARYSTLSLLSSALLLHLEPVPDLRPGPALARSVARRRRCLCWGRRRCRSEVRALLAAVRLADHRPGVFRLADPAGGGHRRSGRLLVRRGDPRALARSGRDGAALGDAACRPGRQPDERPVAGRSRQPQLRHERADLLAGARALGAGHLLSGRRPPAGAWSAARLVRLDAAGTQVTFPKACSTR